jgi:L-threonylcarbamoyladenylate synthase
MSDGSKTTLRLVAGPAGLATASDILRSGGLVAFPTETVYGLGAGARSAEAVAGIYAAKTRPRFNPLIAHVESLEAAEAEGRFGPDARALARAFWPGSLTLVVPIAPGCRICDLARAGLDSVALRVPSHPVARALLAAAGLPVAAPSANRSGRVSPTTADHVLRDLDGRIDAILDGGRTAVGVESTIVACLDEPVLLRPGGVTREAIEAVLGRRLAEPRSDGPTVAPGMLLSHYAPRAAVRLDAVALAPGEAGLDFGGRFVGQGARATLDLSPRADLAEAAANLFGFLRRLDDALGGSGCIAVAPIPGAGLGEAIADRLARAAAPR